MWLLSLALADDLPLPVMNPSPTWAQHEFGFGTGLWQAPSHGHGYPRWVGRINVNATYTAVLRRRWRAGLHTAFQSVPYGPPDRRLRSTVVRLEPRIGIRLGSGDAGNTDLALGVALDASGAWPVGPVLSLSPKWWVGQRKQTFVFLEARLAPLFTMTSNSMLCSSWCNQTFIPNPGGTGILVGVGRTSPRP